MDAKEIQQHIESSVETKMSEVSSRSDRMLAEGVRALWEIAFQLAKITDSGVNTFEMNDISSGGFGPRRRSTD